MSDKPIIGIAIAAPVTTGILTRFIDAIPDGIDNLACLISIIVSIVIIIPTLKRIRLYNKNMALANKKLIMEIEEIVRHKTEKGENEH